MVCGVLECCGEDWMLLGCKQMRTSTCCPVRQLGSQYSRRYSSNVHSSATTANLSGLLDTEAVKHYPRLEAYIR